MAELQITKYPPYQGKEPFIFLCFHDADAQRIEPILAHLYRRGCRIWYCMGKTTDPAENKPRTERKGAAALMVYYLTPNSRADELLRSALLHYQSSGKPVISIDTEAIAGGGELALGFNQDVRHIPAYALSSVEEVEAALIRTEGFSLKLIGEPPTQHGRRKRLALILIGAAVLLIGGIVFYARTLRPDAVAAEDTVMVSDSVIREAARLALPPDGSTALTEDTIKDITTLHLQGVPKSFDALSMFPALTRLEIQQTAVQAAAELLPDSAYTIVVYGEAER